MKSRAFLALTVFLALFAAGCASGDVDEMSARPWNAPQGWEHGVPRGMLEGR